MALSRCNAVGARLLLALAVLVTAYAMLSPQPPSGLPRFEQSDKLWHLLAFAGLALLADLGWPERGFDLRKVLPLLTYAALTEGLQHFVPGREADPLDLLADATGLLCHAVLIRPLLRPRMLA